MVGTNGGLMRLFNKSSQFRRCDGNDFKTNFKEYFDITNLYIEIDIIKMMFSLHCEQLASKL